MVRFIIILLLTTPLLSSQNPSAINIGEAVEIGGIQHWISIKGTNRSNPVLLFLHGGPGNSAMGYADSFTGELQEHFVVVQWDQRESGATEKLNASDKPLSVALMEEDAIEMINYLRSRFSQDKVYLMGHSWGGFLGLRVAARHPELLKAYLAISPMVNQLESERISLAWMIDKAKNQGNKRALTELALVNIPFQNGDQLYYHRSWLAKLTGNKSPSQDFVETWAKKWLPLFNEASAVNFFAFAPEIRCPIYFFVGKLDYQTHYQLTEAYYIALDAKEKRLFWFDSTGHNLTSKEPKKLQQIIISEILTKSDN